MPVGKDASGEANLSKSCLLGCQPSRRLPEEDNLIEDETSLAPEKFKDGVVAVSSRD
jgi:hypothetical protein